MAKKPKPKPKKKKRDTKPKFRPGQPTKYEGKKTLREAERYIRSCKDGLSKVLESSNSKTGRKRFKYHLGVNLPKAEGLAFYLGVHRDTLYEWAKVHKAFSDILERINQIQADKVINKALSGQYNPMIAKLLLGKHGYKERHDVTSDDEPIPILKLPKNNK